MFENCKPQSLNTSYGPLHKYLNDLLSQTTIVLATLLHAFISHFMCNV